MRAAHRMVSAYISSSSLVLPCCCLLADDADEEVLGATTATATGCPGFSSAFKGICPD